MFLKTDKSKLKARQLYKVIEVYTKNDEHWATIQKHDSQFRSKKYQVKFSEIIPLPGQAPKPQRPVRKSAVKAREMFSKLNSVRQTTHVPPTHGWDYKKMLELIEFDDEESFSTPLIPNNPIHHHLSDDSTDIDSPTHDSSDNFTDAN